MDPSNQPKGHFTINLNYRRKANDRAPDITGRISTPESPDQEFSFSAFEQTDKNGDTYWIGPVDTATSLRRALGTLPERGHNFIAIRENGFKVFAEDRDGNPNPAYQALTPEERAREDAKPAFWAKWTRHPENDPVLDAHAWEREPNRYGPWASGNTQHHLNREQLDQVLKAPEPAKAGRRAARQAEPERG